MFERILKEVERFVTYHRFKAIVAALDDVYFTRMWTLHGFSLVTFCQRVVTSSVPLVSAHMTPEWLMETDEKLPEAKVTNVNDRELIIKVRAGLRQRMPAARDDALGFQTICHAANFAWVKVWFIHELAARGGPAPRRQELPEGSFTSGVVPDGVRPYVVTYGWAAVEHFSPSGAKLAELSKVLRFPTVLAATQVCGEVFLHIVPRCFASSRRSRQTSSSSITCPCGSRRGGCPLSTRRRTTASTRWPSTGTA